MTGSGTERVRVWITPRFASRPPARDLREAPEAILAEGRTVRGGRTPHTLLDASRWGAPIRVRPGRHGGALGPILGARYASGERAGREHELVSALFAQGLPVIEPAFAVAWRRGLTWRIATATVDRPEARDAHEWLEGGRSRASCILAARAIARTLRRLHDAGVRHGDLQLKNLLLTVPSRRDLDCVAVDFDRATCGSTPLSAPARMREWMRLVRSCEKSGRHDVLSPRVVAAALHQYCGGDRALRRALLERLPSESARLRRHRWLWRILGKARRVR